MKWPTKLKLMCAGNCLLGGFNLANAFVWYTPDVFGILQTVFSALAAVGSALSAATCLHRLNNTLDPAMTPLSVLFKLLGNRTVDKNGNIVTVESVTASAVHYRLANGQNQSRCLRGFVNLYRPLDTREAMLAVRKRKWRQSWRSCNLRARLD